MPTWHVRGIEQLPFLDLERSTYGYADGSNRPVPLVRGLHQLLEIVLYLGKRVRKRFSSPRRHLDSLENCAIERAFNARSFRAADVETDNGS